MRRYEKYKPSGIEWIGEIPEHYFISRLKYICNINAATLPETTNPDFDLKYIDIGNVSIGSLKNAPSLIRFADAPSRARRIVHRGDTLVSTVRTYLKAISFIDSDDLNLIASTGFAVLTPNEIFNAKYLFYLMMTEGVVDTICSVSVGVSYPAAAPFQIENIFVPYTSDKEEQKSIAFYLDRKTAEIDDLIAKKQHLIDLLNEEKTAIINHAVTKGLNPYVHMKDSGIPLIGAMPAHWQMTKLRFLGDIKYGLGTPPKARADGLPLIRATDIQRGEIVEDAIVYVDPEDLPYDRDPILREKDIVVVRSGAYTGDSAIIPRKYEGAIIGYDMVIRITNAHPLFISQSLLSHYVLNVQLHMHRLRAAQPHLNREELGETLILLPNRDEQERISAFITDKVLEIKNTISKISSETILLQEYRTALISEVVTGKIDVRGAN